MQFQNPIDSKTFWIRCGVIELFYSLQDRIVVAFVIFSRLFKIKILSFRSVDKKIPCIKYINAVLDACLIYVKDTLIIITTYC